MQKSVKGRINRALIGGGIVLTAMACESPSATQNEQPTAPTETAPKRPKVDPQEAHKKELKTIHEAAAAAESERNWPEARRSIERGIEIANQCGHPCELKKAELYLLKANVARENSSELDARRFYADAMAIFHVHKATRGRFETYIAMGQLEAGQGDYVAAARQFDQAKALLSKISEKPLIGEFHLQLGRLAARQLKHENALKSYQEAVRIFDVAEKKKAMAETLFLVASEEDALGRTGPCYNYLSRALRLFRSLEDLEGEARVIHRLAALAERDKKYNKARKLLKQVHELYVKLDRSSTAAKVERHINALPVSEKKKKR